MRICCELFGTVPYLSSCSISETFFGHGSMICTKQLLLHHPCECKAFNACESLPVPLFEEVLLANESIVVSTKADSAHPTLCKPWSATLKARLGRIREKVHYAPGLLLRIFHEYIVNKAPAFSQITTYLLLCANLKRHNTCTNEKLPFPASHFLSQNPHVSLCYNPLS